MLVFVSGLYTTHDFGRRRDLTRFSKSVDAETGMDSSTWELRCCCSIGGCSCVCVCVWGGGGGSSDCLCV